MDIYEAHGIVTIEKATAMIGKKVKAIGCCGMKEDIEVEGIMEKVDNFGAIVQIPFGRKGYTIPCLVNKNTLEVIEE